MDKKTDLKQQLMAMGKARRLISWQITKLTEALHEECGPSEEFVRAVADANPVEAVRCYRDMTGCTLREAHDYVTAMTSPKANNSPHHSSLPEGFVVLGSVHNEPDMYGELHKNCVKISWIDERQTARKAIFDAGTGEYITECC